MTINLDTEFFLDAFSQNILLTLEREQFSDKTSLAIAEWVISGYPTDSCVKKVFEHIYFVLIAEMPDYELWILIGDGPWQPDNKIRSHRKLFSLLSAQGLSLDRARDRHEDMVTCDGKIKFFAVASLNETLVSTASELISTESCIYLAFLPHGNGACFPLSEGWSGVLKHDNALIKVVANAEGVIFCRTGYFDDPESGFFGIGHPEIISKLVKILSPKKCDW